MGQQSGRRDEEDSRDCSKLQLHRDGRYFLLDPVALVKGFLWGRGISGFLSKKLFLSVPSQTELEVKW